MVSRVPMAPRVYQAAMPEADPRRASFRPRMNVAWVILAIDVCLWICGASDAIAINALATRAR